MRSLLCAFATILLAVALAPVAEALTAGTTPPAKGHRSTLVQLAGCDDDCQEVMEERQQEFEAAREEHHEALHEAREAQREMHEDEPSHGYQRDADFDRRDRAASQRASQQQKQLQQRAKPVPQSASVTVKEKTSPAGKTETDDKIATADSSETKPAEGGTSSPPPAAKYCSQYFPAINRALPVPCE